MDPITAIKNALKIVFKVESGESLLLIEDESMAQIGDRFIKAALDLGLWCRRLTLPDKEKRIFIPKILKQILLSTPPPRICVNILRGNADETPFRVKLINAEIELTNARICHCLGITLDVISEGALALTEEEYKTLQEKAYNLILVLQNARILNVTSENGTDVSFSVEGREFITDTEYNEKNHRMLNLPVGEVMVAPVETSMNGLIVCDIAVGGIGQVKSPILMEIVNGKIKGIHSDDKKIEDEIIRVTNVDNTASLCGEFAVSINNKARVNSIFLEAEKAYGTCHIAFGNNRDFPRGLNNSKTHVDFLISKPTVKAIETDGDEKIIVSRGKLIV
ncbi:MAG: aminopeptidase [Candidatus Odinarchaeia archaeon]